jgi:hypothetical protein
LDDIVQAGDAGDRTDLPAVQHDDADPQPMAAE